MNIELDYFSFVPVHVIPVKHRNIHLHYIELIIHVYSILFGDRLVHL